MSPSRFAVLAIVLTLGVASITRAASTVLRVEGGQVGSALRARAINAAGERWEATALLSEEMEFSVPLDVSAGWRLTVESDGFWAAPVEVRESPTRVRLERRRRPRR